MAYKFQIGNFRSGGNIQMAGGTSLSGSITNSIPDDATVDAVVAELDDQSLQATKLALATDPALEAVNQGGVEKLQLKIEANKGLTKGASGVAAVANQNASVQVDNNGIGVKIKANNGLGHDGTNGMVAVPDGAKGMEVSSNGLAVKLRADKGLGLHSDGLEIQPESNKGIGLSNNGIAVLVNANASAQVDSNGVGVNLSNNKGLGHDGSNGLQVLIQADKGLGVGAGGLTAVVDGDALQLGATGIDLKNSIAGNRTFTGNLVVDGDFQVNGSTVTLSASNLLIEDKVIQVAKDANSQASSKDSGILFGQGNANGARWLYEIDGESNQVLSAKQGSGNQLIRISAAEFLGPATQGAVLNETGQNQNRRLLFADNAGAQDFKSNSNLTFNSQTGRLSAPEFSGDGSNLTNLPLGMFPVSNKNATAGVVALQSMAYNILGNGGQGNGTHKFQVQGSYANGDEIRIKAPSDAASNRVYQITASAAYTFDGQSTLSLASPDTAITLVYVGGNQFKIF